MFIHPYDDPDVIAGQGTIAMEILRQHPVDLTAIFVPVGGGGLIAGLKKYVEREQVTGHILIWQSLDRGANGANRTTSLSTMPK